MQGREVTSTDIAPFHTGSETTESVGEFPYTGSVVMATARVDGDIKKRIQQGSKAFGALRQAILVEKSLTIN